MFSPERIVNAQQMSRISKATVQKTGRLGFSSSAIGMLGLSAEKTIILFEDDSNRDLYLVVMDARDDRGFFVRARIRSLASAHAVHPPLPDAPRPLTPPLAHGSSLGEQVLRDIQQLCLQFIHIGDYTATKIVARTRQCGYRCRH